MADQTELKRYELAELERWQRFYLELRRRFPHLDQGDASQVALELTKLIAYKYARRSRQRR